MKIAQIVKLIGAIAFCELVGIAGSIFTFPSIPTWYASINKAPFNPPSFIFGPSWTILYLLMGVSLYLVWDKVMKKKKTKLPLIVFFIQLFLNFLWSIIFFGLHLQLYAFFDIGLLWLAILVTIIAFWKLSKTASMILLPYLLWVSFASVLNFFVVILNP